MTFLNFPPHASPRPSISYEDSYYPTRLYCAFMQGVENRTYGAVDSGLARCLIKRRSTLFIESAHGAQNQSNCVSPTALVRLVDPFAKAKLRPCSQKLVSKVVQATRRML